MISATLQSACDNAVRTSRRGDTRSGIGLARHAYRLARQESEAAEVTALNALALCQSANGSFIESVATAIDAYHLAKKVSDPVGAVLALSTIGGSASFILDASDFLLELLDSCLAEANALSDAVLQARVYLVFGLVYVNMGRFAEGDAAYERALALVEHADDRAALVTPRHYITGNHAALAVRRLNAIGTVDRAHFIAVAEARVGQFLASTLTENNIDAAARAYFSLGQMRAFQGQPAAAEAAFAESISHAKHIHHIPRQIDSYLEMGNLHFAAQRFEEAIVALEAASDLADGNRPTSKIARIFTCLADSYVALGRTRDAAHFHAKAVHERESFVRENASAISNIHAFWRPHVSAPGDPPAAT